MAEQVWLDLREPLALLDTALTNERASILINLYVNYCSHIIVNSLNLHETFNNGQTTSLYMFLS